MACCGDKPMAFRTVKSVPIQRKTIVIRTVKQTDLRPAVLRATESEKYRA